MGVERARWRERKEGQFFLWTCLARSWHWTAKSGLLALSWKETWSGRVTSGELRDLVIHFEGSKKAPSQPKRDMMYILYSARRFLGRHTI